MFRQGTPDHVAGDFEARGRSAFSQITENLKNFALAPGLGELQEIWYYGTVFNFFRFRWSLILMQVIEDDLSSVTCVWCLYPLLTNLNEDGVLIVTCRFSEVYDGTHEGRLRSPCPCYSFCSSKPFSREAVL